MVLPVVVKGVLGGCMYVDRLASAPPPESTTLTLVRRLRDAAAQAMAQRKT